MENNLTNKTWWPITLTIKQAIEYTGYSRQSINDLVNNGQLEFLPGPSRNKRIPRHQIDQLIGLKSEPESEEVNEFKNL